MSNKLSFRQRVEGLLVHSKHRVAFRVASGIAVSALVIASFGFFQNAAQALKNLVSQGYTGYYNNAYYSTNASLVSAGATYVSSSKPSAVSSLSATAGSAANVMTISFGAVTTTADSLSLDNFSTYRIWYSTTSGGATPSAGTNASSLVTSGTLTTQGSGTLTFTLTGLTCGTTYYFNADALDDLGTSGNLPSAVSAATGSCTATSGGGGGGGGSTTTTTSPTTTPTPTPTPTPAPAPAPVATEQTPAVPAAGRSATQEQAAVTALAKNNLGGHPSLAAIKLVVAYGLGGVSYGTGENAAVVREYIEAFKLQAKELKDECEWKDINRLMHGVGPTCHKPEAGAWGKALSEFKKIYKRTAGACNGGVADEFDRRALAFWGTGARHPRKLSDEAAAIKTWVGVNKREPKDAFDWRGVKAIAYSGVARACPSLDKQREKLPVVPGVAIQDAVQAWTAALLGR